MFGSKSPERVQRLIRENSTYGKLGNKGELKLPVPTYVPANLQGWWGGPDKRVRCSFDCKVVFEDKAAADRSAAAATARGCTMFSYQGNRCGHWHTTRKTR